MRPQLGKQVSVRFELASTARAKQDLRIDDAVHLVKANGARRPEVFRLRRLERAPKGSVGLEERLSFVDRTTRKHYRGRHAIELLVNEGSLELCEFEVA